MIKLLLIVAAGAGIGALLGLTRSCETGGCPLTATPWRGAMYGAFLAALAGFGFVRPPAGTEADTVAESEKVIAISSAEQFEAEVLAAEGPCLVDFYATWCGPCKQLMPTMAAIAEEPGSPVKVVKVNVDENRELARKYGVQSIPDVRLFVGGREVDRFVGVQPKNVYLDAVAGTAQSTAR